jgi:hypothetical protein
MHHTETKGKASRDNLHRSWGLHVRLTTVLACRAMHDSLQSDWAHQEVRLSERTKKSRMF